MSSLQVGHPKYQFVHALRSTCDEVPDAGKRALLGEFVEFITRVQELKACRARQSSAQDGHALGEFVLGANDELRRCGWRRRAEVGDKIADREIGLVTYGGDNRNIAGGNGAREAFV